MEQQTIQPQVIKEIPFPGQSSESSGEKDTKSTFYPDTIPGVNFPKVNIASSIRSLNLNTEARTIGANFTFQNLGAISIGTVSGTGTALSGTGVRISPYGIYGYNAGSVKFSLNALTGDAVFAGTIQAGTVVASGALVVGTNVGLGTAQDSAGVTTIVGNTITTGYINALNVQAATVKTDWVYAGNISANQINAGTLSADYITGGSLTIGGSSDSLGTIVVKNSSNVEVTKLNRSGIIVRNTQGLFFESVTSLDYFKLQNNGSSEAVLTLPNTNKFYIKNSAENVNLFTVSSTQTYSENGISCNGTFTGKTLYLNYGQNEGNIYAVDQIKGYNDLRTYTDGTGSQFWFYSNQGGGNVNVYPYYGDLYKTGSVSFRIPHPDHPDTGWIHYTCNESPEVSLTLRGRTNLVNGKATITTPHHWDLVSADTLTTINVSPLEDCKGLFVPKQTLTRNGFVVKELQNGKSNIEITWELTVVRKGYENYNPEPMLSDDADRAVKAMVETENITPEQHKMREDREKDKNNQVKELARQRYLALKNKKR